MNAFTLATASIRNRSLHSLLCVSAVVAGIALLCAAFLLSQGINEGLIRNIRGIDVVAGAKGSPLQLVLSSIYHADIPTGNIETADAQELMKNPQIKEVIPMTMGDNYKGWRVVGTTPAYLELYHAQFAQGRTFTQNFEAVAGAETGLKIGEEFAALHGFAADSSDVHNFHLYKITGILKPTGTVLDRLITTPYESVQQLHSHPDAGDPDAAEELKIGHQITALLIKVKSPRSVMNLPREINRSSNIMAASPGYEMTRLSANLGIGKHMLVIFAAGVVTLSMLMLLSTLASNLTVRRYDLAVMRVLGASQEKLFTTVLIEGGLLSTMGAFIGILIGHVLAFWAATSIPTLHGIVLPGGLLHLQKMDIVFLALGLCAGMTAALVPAISAARTDIATLLARGLA